MAQEPQLQRAHRPWRDWTLGVVGHTSAGRSLIFRRIYRLNRWGSAESASGLGSDSSQTARVRRELPALLARHQVSSLVDAPCGDLFWFRPTLNSRGWMSYRPGRPRLTLSSAVISSCT